MPWPYRADQVARLSAATKSARPADSGDTGIRSAPLPGPDSVPVSGPCPLTTVSIRPRFV
jgi:hypothetical protein